MRNEKKKCTILFMCAYTYTNHYIHFNLPPPHRLYTAFYILKLTKCYDDGLFIRCPHNVFRRQSTLKTVRSTTVYILYTPFTNDLKLLNHRSTKLFLYKKLFAFVIDNCN